MSSVKNIEDYQIATIYSILTEKIDKDAANMLNSGNNPRDIHLFYCFLKRYVKQ